MLDLNDLLAKAGIEPAKTVVMRHRPHEPELRRVFSWIAAERPDLFNAYQSTHYPRTESALKRATHLVSMIGIEPGTANLVGLFANEGHIPISTAEFWRNPLNQELSRFGMAGWSEDRAETEILLFELRLDPAFREYEHRIEFGWPGLERSWYRWADRNTFPIRAISSKPFIETEMPEWDRLVLEWREIANLPQSWALRMSQWRGIYLITDQSDGMRYVGSAYGTQNLLGRWRTYAHTGHGGNTLLRRRDPANFHFSILQRVSPDMDPEDVIALEESWKIRLQTRALGLNAN